jgi:hypothetical protein
MYLTTVERLDALAETAGNAIVDEGLLQRLLKSRVQVQDTAISDHGGGLLLINLSFFVGHFFLEVTGRLVLQTSENQHIHFSTANT